MHTLVPTYYKNFKCIADKCQHSCCIGWEVDIDPKKLKYYNSLSGEISLLLKENIDLYPEPHFILKEGDRCPFLKENGLCHLICELGEDALCGICSDHPRFRNFYSKGEEMGLGLCCEEAARIILLNSEPFKLEGNGDIYSNEEKQYAELRDKYISIVQNTEVPFKERLFELLNVARAQIDAESFNNWISFFLSLERLNESWTELLLNPGMQAFDFNVDQDKSKLLANLCTYFIFRHITPEAFEEGADQRITFCVLATVFIHTLTVGNLDKYGSYEDTLCHISRMFSSEIEYSDENLNLVLDEILFLR